MSMKLVPVINMKQRDTITRKTRVNVRQYHAVSS